jgi:hypothetical protein
MSVSEAMALSEMATVSLVIVKGAGELGQVDGVVVYFLI